MQWIGSWGGVGEARYVLGCSLQCGEVNRPGFSSHLNGGRNGHYALKVLS